MLLPAILVANIGVPMLLLLWPAHWLAWVPLTVLQAELAYRRFALPRKRAIKVAGIAKLTSTALGIPLAWAGMLAVQIATGAALSVIDEGTARARWMTLISLPLQCAWLEPTQEAWRVYLAFALLAVPCFAASVMIECAITRRMLKVCEPRLVRAWVIRANLLGHLLLVVAAAAYPILNGGRAW